MKKVMLVLYGGLDIGGVQTVMMNIVRNLHDKYIFDAVITTDEIGEFEEEFQSYGGKIFRIPCRINDTTLIGRMDFYIRGGRIRRRFKKILKENGPYTAVHCNFGPETGLFLKSAKQYGVPTRIYHSHGLREWNGKINFVRRVYTKYLNYLIGNNTTNYVGCSEKVCKTWFEGLDYQVIYNFLSPEFNSYAEKKQEPRDWSFIHVGRFCVTKNQLFIIEVFNEIHNVHSEAKLTLVGYNSSNYSESVYKLVRDLKLENSVNIVPATTDVIKYYERNSYMIFPSLSEGLGIALLEAQIMGVHCFPSNRVTQECNVGNCSFIPLKYDKTEWANAILDIIENKIGEYKICSEKGRFSQETIIQQYENLYG